jgi:hypothetical protein
MSQDKDSEIEVSKENKPKFVKKKNSPPNKRPYGFIKTVDEKNELGTISMGKNMEAIFHFKECSNFQPTVGQNVTFSLIEV